MEIISYAVIKNTSSFGRVNHEEMVDFDCVKDAVRYARQLKDTDCTWYTVEVKYD